MTAMGYISVAEFAEKFGVPQRTARNYCAMGKIPGAFLTGKTWNIPEDAGLPVKRGQAAACTPLLRTLREQKEMKLGGGIYHRTQVDLAYNSNHIEGSRLTHDQTRHIFETNTIGLGDESVNVDDILETANHFRCLDMVIDRATERLTDSFIKELHAVLKGGTSDSRRGWFAVGDYKKLPNEVGGIDPLDPAQVDTLLLSLRRA